MIFYKTVIKKTLDEGRLLTMKNILIWGVPRSGKSILANMIRKEFGHSVVQLDAIKRVYDVLRPADNIYGPKTTNFDEAKLMAPMLTQLIKCMSWRNDREEFHVYEGVGFDLKTILSALPKDKFPIPLNRFIVICMGYSEISPAEKVEQMILHDTESDWSFQESNSSKLAHCELYCDESKIIKETAAKLGLKYFDISYDFEKVLTDIVQYVKKNMSD